MISFHSFCSMIVEDVLNGTTLHYALRNPKFEKSIWSDQKMDVLTFSSPAEWNGLIRLEENLNSWAKQLMIDEELKNTAIKSMRKDLLFLYKQKSIEFGEIWEGEYQQSIQNYCNKIIPESLYLEMDAFTLNGHVLVVDLNVYAIEKDRPGEYDETLQYDELHYFDLNTGEKLDPSTFFDTSKLTQLRNKIKKEVPKEVWVSIQNTENLFTEPVFYGASFYFILSGSANASNETSFNYHQRFTLEEIKPFLNKSGAFKPYLNHTEEFPVHPFIFTSDIETSGAWYQKDYIALLNEDYLIEEDVNPEIHSASYYHQTENGDRLVEFAKYNNNGKIILKVRYDLENSLTEDSTTYSYHTNGLLKSIESYSFEEADENEDTEKNDEDDEDDDNEDIIQYKAILNETCFFNEQEYLIESVYYNEDWSEYFSYNTKEFVKFHYFKNKMIYDGYVESVLGSGISIDFINAIDIWNNYGIERDVKMPTIPIKINDTKIHQEKFYNNNDTHVLDLTLEDNRIISGTQHYGKSNTIEFKIKYNANGQPISYSDQNHSLEYDTISSHIYTVERDRFGKVISYEVKYITPKAETTHKYKVVYE